MPSKSIASGDGGGGAAVLSDAGPVADSTAAAAVAAVVTADASGPRGARVVDEKGDTTSLRSGMR